MKSLNIIILKKNVLALEEEYLQCCMKNLEQRNYILAKDYINRILQLQGEYQKNLESNDVDLIQEYTDKYISELIKLRHQ